MNSSLAAQHCSYKLRRGDCNQPSISPILSAPFHPREMLPLLSLQCAVWEEGEGDNMLYPSAPSRSECRILEGEEKGQERQNISPWDCGEDVE